MTERRKAGRDGRKRKEGRLKERRDTEMGRRSMEGRKEGVLKGWTMRRIEGCNEEVGRIQEGLMEKSERGK